MNRYYPLGLFVEILLLQPVYGTDTIIPFIGADAVHAQGIYGQGVTVVVIDSGIHSDHPGLQGSIVSGGITFADQIRAATVNGRSYTVRVADPLGCLLTVAAPIWSRQPVA